MDLLTSASLRLKPRGAAERAFQGAPACRGRRRAAGSVCSRDLPNDASNAILPIFNTDSNVSQRWCGICAAAAKSVLTGATTKPPARRMSSSGTWVPVWPGEESSARRCELAEGRLNAGPGRSVVPVG